MHSVGDNRIEPRQWCKTLGQRTEIEFGARSDVGRVRENNEDAFLLNPELNLFVLSDGMGGQASGEVASRTVTEVVANHCRDAESNPSLPFCGPRVQGLSERSNRLASAIRLANHTVHQMSRQASAQHGMGATIVALWAAEERMSLAHVGDSRAYRLRGRQLYQLTQDHSFVAEQVRRGLMTSKEAEASKLQNVLLRALGPDPDVEVEVSEELLLEGDTLLLCSDGLTRELSVLQIAAVLGETEEAKEAADHLVDLANQAGGGDNITAIVLRYEPRPVGAFARIGRWFRNSEDRS
jgi:PPM family protein phosphatase